MTRSGLIFDPATGLHSPDTADIREGVAEDWRQAFFSPDQPPLDTEAPTPAGQLIDAESAEIEAKNAELLYLANQFNPQTADGRWQDALGYIYFLRRKLDEATVVTCQITGRMGLSIPYGAQAQALSGHKLICNRAVTIGADGKAETTFRLAENGPIDIPPHSVTGIVTTIPGWDSIDNEAAGAVGRVFESQSEFEARRAASVAVNAHGSTGSLYGSIANLPGVLDVQVLENVGPYPVEKFGVIVPGHGVTVCVYGGEEQDIAEAIYNKKDNGCDTGGNTEIVYLRPDYHNAEYRYRIERPEPINFRFRVTLGPSAALTPQALESLKQSLYQDFYGLNAISGNGRIGLASTVYASRFYAAALSVDGVKDLQSIEIALGENPQDDDFKDVLSIKGSQEPVTSTENIEVIQR